MTSALKQQVLRYFRGVDDEDIDLLLSTLTQDCVFSVETHGVSLTGHAEITGMFERLWSHHEWVRHDQFHWVEDGSGDAIAVRFQVTNKLPDNTLVQKSNCNFFTVKDGLFSEVRVYMTGENTLDKKA
jgi:ketosteroid isomerase-like protein